VVQLSPENYTLRSRKRPAAVAAEEESAAVSAATAAAVDLTVSSFQQEEFQNSQSFI